MTPSPQARGPGPWGAREGLLKDEKKKRKKEKKKKKRKKKKRKKKKRKKRKKKKKKRRGIVAKALDGQRYPLPLCELMWV